MAESSNSGESERPKLYFDVGAKINGGHRRDHVLCARVGREEVAKRSGGASFASTRGVAECKECEWSQYAVSRCYRMVLKIWTERLHFRT